MILYFSGTGNSEFVAKRISKGIDDECINLFEKIQNNDYSLMHSDKPWVIVSPIYAWRLPRVIQEWIENTTFTGNQNIYFVLTCGINIGNASKYLDELCKTKKMHYCGCKEVVMPENYIVLFTPPTPQKGIEIIKQALPSIDEAIDCIQYNKVIPEIHVSLKDRIYSGIVNDLFYPVFVHAKKFRVTSECIGCGQCTKVCPLNNIELIDGKPVWQDACTHCMACICRCPKEAIEYGRQCLGKPRYTCIYEDTTTK